MKPFGYQPGDTWEHLGFRLRCFTHGVEVVGRAVPAPLRVVFPHRRRAEEAISEHVAKGPAS